MKNYIENNKLPDELLKIIKKNNKGKTNLEAIIEEKQIAIEHKDFERAGILRDLEKLYIDFLKK